MRMRRRGSCRTMRICFHYAWWMLPTLGVCSACMDPRKAGLSIEEFAPDDDLGIFLSKERDFEAKLSHISRVKEDVLEIVFLSDDEES